MVGAIREGTVLRVRPQAMTVAILVPGFFAIYVRHRNRLSSNVADRSAHGRRHDHCTASSNVRDSGSLFVNAAETRGKPTRLYVKLGHVCC